MNLPATVAAAVAAALCAAPLLAQARPTPAAAARPWSPPAPRGMPATPPPVDHPAMALQVLQTAAQATAGTRSEAAGGPAAPAACDADPVAAAAAEAQAQAEQFRRLRVDGSEVEAGVERVAERLEVWDDRVAACGRAAATGRTVLWVQALGDLEGFA